MTFSKILVWKKAPVNSRWPFQGKNLFKIGNYTIFYLVENRRRGRQARNFTTNVPKTLDLKSSSEQIFSENWRLVPLFIERYYDTKRDIVSYNYRIVYSSCDRPLTHLQSAEMQKKKKKKLLNCEFQLYLYNSGYGAARLHGYGASRATYYGLTCLRAWP